MKLFLNSFFFILLTTIVSCTPLSAPKPKVSVISSVVFVSDSGQVIQAIYRDDGTVTLTFPDNRIEMLNLAVSASGARYVAGMNEWWEHQGEATYSVNDERVFTGRLQRQPAN
ncbi:MAG: MliC family protein [Nitrosomonas sp.]|uniref:MliC family protein n=1 Tax=Nitrosomonas sp. TaxID=42353 RepID=UPI002B3A81AD|nr:MliC family protein [Nitrosomonas sp.]MEB2332103.1 MliC family protein [Nitrosomonas sp.]